MKTPNSPNMKTLHVSALLLTACFAAEFAQAQSTWTGGGADQNWSTPGNWGSGVVPNNNAVTFPDGAFPVTTNVQGVANNIVQSSTAIASLTYNNLNADFDTTQIPAGTTLTVNGNMTVGTSDSSANRTIATMTGGGSLIVGTGASTLSGQNGNGNNPVSVLDLSGLSTFVFNPAGTGGTVNLGTGSSGAGINMTLAAVSNAITAATFNLGNNNTRGPNTMNLGPGTNIIYADTINLAISKTSGTLQFTNGGGLTIANRAGTGRSTINISGEANTGSTTANNNGFMLFDGGTVNILAGGITIGNRQARASGTANGTLAFNSGIVDANTINMATNLSGGGAANGTIAVGGSGVLKVNGSISLVAQAGTAGAGMLIVTNGGMLICSNSILKTTSTGVGTVSIANGTLVLGGTMGGGGNAVDNFDITNAMLTLPALGAGQPAVTVANFSPDFVTTSNIINIGSLPAISSYPTQLPLISYTTPSGNLDTMILGTLPTGFSGYISNNATGVSIDLVLTNGPAAKADIWRGNVNSLWDTTTLNWISSSAPANYLDLDEVTFDDTAATGNVTVTGARMPATVNGLTFNNNSIKYVFSGSGKITGPVQLVMNGSGSVTLSETGGDNFSGGISVNAGTLIMDNTNAAISGGLNIANGSATVQVGNNDGVGTLPAGTIDNEGTLIFQRTNNLSIGSVIPGAGSLVQNGSGTLTLTAHNTYGGNTIVGTGTLALSGNGTIVNSAQVTVTNGTLDVSGISAPTTLTILDMTNSALKVKVGYLQTNLTVTTLNLGGTSNLLNVGSLPPIAYYPSTNVLLQSSTSINGYNFMLGSLPAATPAYAGTIALSSDGTAVLLTLTAGPSGVRPSVTWSGSDAQGGISTNWSDALNWQTPGVPAPTEPVSFNNTATGGGTPFDAVGNGPGGVVNPGNIDNIVDINLTNATLTYANSGGSFHNTQIVTNKTLTVNGAFAVNGSSGDVTILGGGTLKINNPGNATTFNVQNGTAPTLDMSGLDTFVASVTQFGVGINSASTGSTVSGALYLAHTNTINTGGGFSGVGASMIVGGGGAGSGQLFLGQSNALYVDGITLGIATSGNDLIAFNSAFSNSPVAYIRGTLGDASRVTLWSLGDSTVNLNNSTPNGNLTNDFTAGKLDALVDTLVIGSGSQGNNPPTVPFKGMFNMGQGRLDVTTLKVGAATTGNPAGIGVGIMSVSNGTVVAGTLALPASTAASGAGVTGTTGTLSLTNATLIVSNGITVAANSGGGTLNAIGSAVKVLNGTIGGPLTPIVNLTLDGGSLQLPVDGNAVSAVLTATTITTGAPTTINIGSINNVTSAVQLPLIGYNGTDPYPALTLGTYPAGYTVALVDNVGNSSVDVSITPTAAPSMPHITSISISGATLHLTATNGSSSGQFALLSSTNLTLPLSQWTPVLTNNFDSNGNLNLSTNVVDPSVGRLFYMLRAP